MEFNKEQKKALKLAVEETGYGYFQDMEIAKDNLDGLSKQIEEVYGMKPSDFKKIVKFFAKSKMDEEKAKMDEFYSLYREVIG